MQKLTLIFPLLISEITATDAYWISTSNNNMATAANWSDGSVPNGDTAIFNSSSPTGVITNLAWDPDNATPPYFNPQFFLNSVDFATNGCISVFIRIYYNRY